MTQIHLSTTKALRHMQLRSVQQRSQKRPRVAPMEVHYGDAVRLLRDSVTLLESSTCSQYLMWLAQMMPHDSGEASEATE